VPDGTEGKGGVKYHRVVPLWSQKAAVGDTGVVSEPAGHKEKGLVLLGVLFAEGLEEGKSKQVLILVSFFSLPNSFRLVAVLLYIKSCVVLSLFL
jgi:hypothetical protein